MLAFRLTGLPDSRLPLYLYCVGTQEEKVQFRPDGFPVYKLFLLRSGKGEFKVQDEGVWNVSAGELFVLEPGVAHEYIPHSKTHGELGYIGIGGEAAGAVLRSAGLLPMGPLRLSEFEKFWSRVTAIWHSLDDGMTEMWNSSTIIYQLILDISRSILPLHDETGEREARNRSLTRSEREFESANEAFTRAVSLMHTHYQDDLLLKYVAEAVGYSVQHLNRLFHQRHGGTGHQYMQRLRLQKASEWMDKHPRASVREAAETVGMEVNYFIRMYKREFGETPGKEIKHRIQLKMEKDSTGPVDHLYEV
ncbi:MULTISPECIES: AraC family transcriptional regulator [unclassified Paenibacillus]|uniref:AraC family transcriptional regulator n=1 Tax=unclassified Paenibacillus TaxID=185978 RepID=UPI0009A7CC99|nr:MULTISPECIES: AraC family transcriptional regulator [unclassified Paenibacillus]SLK18862.1 AraC-type DNA-binding protein [Paenibacillus sp. RU5A]SOC75455.1 AraC-type DNA-binding protein [Paenibacillus sp. RU26A]SOC77434.1 AraC-type DNA-binding protein [Paenibacillus sp. RU5M]